MKNLSSATRRLRAGQAGVWAAQLPVIAVTAHAMDGNAERCLQAGMNACLTKPYTLAALAEVVSRWLGATAGRDGQVQG